MKRIISLLCCIILVISSVYVYAANEIVISVHDSRCSLSGSWTESTNSNVAGPTGLTSYYTSSTTASSKYSLKGIDEGTYDVYYYNLTYSTTAKKAVVEVNSSSGIEEGTFNPTGNANGWLAIGTFEFTGDRTDGIKISSTGGGVIREGGIKLVANSTGTKLSAAVIGGKETSSDGSDGKQHVVLANGAVVYEEVGENTDHLTPRTIPEGGELMLGTNDGSFEMSSGWTRSGVSYPTGDPGYYSGSKGVWGQWTPNLAEHKGLTIWYLKMSAGSATTEDPELIVEIYAGGEVTTSIIDFTVGDNGWEEVGTFDFSGNGDEYIKIVRKTEDTKRNSRLTGIKIGYKTESDSNDDVAENSVYTGTDKEILQRMGMLIGEGDGITEEYIKKQPTRAQMATLVLRLNGVYEEAEAFEGSDNFSDVSDSEWYSNILAYIKAHPEYGMVGNMDGSFDPDATIDSVTYQKVMLELMGYEYGKDFYWEHITEFSETAGIGIESNDAFTIDDLAEVTVKALNANMKDSKIKLLGDVIAKREPIYEPKYTNPDVFTEEMRQARNEAKHRDRTLIYNNDGNDTLNWENNPCDLSKVTEPMTKEVFLAKRTTGLEDSQVDSLFYCTGVYNSYTHRSSGETEKRVTDWSHIFWDAEQDSMEIMIEWCEQNDKEFMWSMRMNDVHDARYDEDGISNFKQEHIDWIMARKNNAALELKFNVGQWTALDHTHQGVRQKTYNILRDVLTRYDVDGIELDFSRAEIFFKEVCQGYDAYPESLERMNDMVRSIRTLTEQISAEKGKPILVAIHVPDSIGYSKAIGLDIKQWLEEDLIDVVSVVSYGKIQNYEETIAEYSSYDVPVYLIMDPLSWQGSEQEFDWKKEAGLAYHSGFDGIQIYNVFDPNDSKFDFLGSPDTCEYDPSYVTKYGEGQINTKCNNASARFQTYKKQ